MAKYSFDFDAIIDFVQNTKEPSVNTSSEITEIYVTDEESNEVTLDSKQYREVKENDKSSQDTIRYDLFKNMVSWMIMGQDEGDKLSFTGQMIFNGMLENKLIKKIED
jgi:hypothetical protein